MSLCRKSITFADAQEHIDMDSVADFLASDHQTAFSFEILPPLRGKSVDDTLANVKQLMEYAPAYVNITTHRTEVEYKQTSPGFFSARQVCKRPGTVAISAVLHERLGIRAVPHIICGEYSRDEIEDQLIDLSYLGINDILVLRGDRERSSHTFTTAPNGHLHAADLARQVVDFNNGIMADGTLSQPLRTPFSFGVAGYPEKHEEAMNPSADLQHLKAKIDAGAAYIVTQMFFDNSVYFNFVKRCRDAGITVPIVPGIKPLTSLRQMNILPRVFHIDIPDQLGREIMKCSTDEQVRQLGIEWGIQQARELLNAAVPSIHFYAMHATRSVAEIARNVY